MPARWSSSTRTGSSPNEMNTRRQVEHPVTEMLCGMDLVRGDPHRLRRKLGYGQQDVTFNGHAIECRVTAEDPDLRAFTRQGEHLSRARLGLGVRVDSALYSGYSVPSHYDSLVAGSSCMRRPARRPSRACSARWTRWWWMASRRRCRCAIMADAEFQSGDYTIHWLERFVARGS